MIVGILSDTHGQQARTAAALQLLERLGAEVFIHCGDVGGAQVLEQFVGRHAWLVCGNTDCPDAALLQYARGLGLQIGHPPPARGVLAGKHVVVFHGHEALCGRALAHLADAETLPADFPPCDYLLHGHTHIARHVRCGPVQVINPGALHRAATHTVATLELPAGHVRFWQVSEPADADPRPYRPTHVW
jgi:putative phosphoesterase